MKIIGTTPKEDMKIQEEREAIKAAEEQKDYESQLKAFKKDNSYFKEYKEKVIRKDHVLVRLFFYEFSEYKDSKLFFTDAKGQPKKLSENIYGEVKNVGKVIQSTKEGIEQGDIVVLPFDNAEGVMDNPKWTDYLRSLAAKGADAIPPEDTRKKIPSIEVRWKRYRYKNPSHVKMDESDRLTFLLPDLEIHSIG